MSREACSRLEGIAQVTQYCFESINWSPYFEVPGVSIPLLVEAAAQAGFDWISFDEALLKSAMGCGISLTEIKQLVDEARLGVLAIHSLAISNDRDADQRLAAPLIEAASLLGAPYLHCGVRSDPDDSVRESAKSVARLARESGVAIAIEFLPFLPVASIAETRDIVTACEDNEAGIVVDAWHFFHGPDAWEELASLRASEIAYVQFDDHPPLASNDLLAETTMRRVLPGRGEFDLERFADTIGGTGFDGTVGLELLSEESRRCAPADVAAQLLVASRPYWD